MSRRLWFGFGCASTYALTLNHTFLCERAKQEIKMEITKLKNMHEMKIEDLT